MSTIANHPIELFSHHFTSGRRSFFFDVKRAQRGELYFTISELVEKDNAFTRQRVVVPADQARDFYLGLCEAIKAMRKLESAPAEEPAPVKQRSEPKKAPRAFNREAAKAS